jgi:hypothetical protein
LGTRGITSATIQEVAEEEIERSRDQFRLANVDSSWVAQLDEIAVSPPAADWRSSLEMLGLDRDDADLVTRTFPDRDADSDRWWMLDRMRSAIADGMPGGDPAVPLRRMDDHGVLGTLFPLHVLAAVVPDALQFHRDHGVPASVSRTTLDVTSALSRDDAGVPIVDTSGWFLWRFRGLLYQVEALRVIPVRLGEAPDSQAYYEDADEPPALRVIGEGTRP